jgi:hypothetical protein
MDCNHATASALSSSILGPLDGHERLQVDTDPAILHLSSSDAKSHGSFGAHAKAEAVHHVGFQVQMQCCH